VANANITRLVLTQGKMLVFLVAIGYHKFNVVFKFVTALKFYPVFNVILSFRCFIDESV